MMSALPVARNEAQADVGALTAAAPYSAVLHFVANPSGETLTGEVTAKIL
jgi:hypothetical protein